MSTKANSLKPILDKLAEGETVQLSFFDNEIGGELLNILSKGLYTNPLDAIREYVQNSIDADANEVKIQVTGNSVFISDDGVGMDRERLLQSREFGVSLKSMEENVGFRGIGIYSGFDLCNRLVMRTKKASDPVEHILTFKFGDMKKKLDSARQNPKRPVLPLSLLLSEGISYSYEKSSRKNESFTIVQLEELTDNHINKISNIEQMRRYILNNLPVKFNKDFKYAKQIESALRKKIPGYKDAKIILQIESSGEIVVEKPNILDLNPPVMDFIKDTDGNSIAYYWACLTSTSDAISSSKKEQKELADFAGLVYKIKGFTIGDRNYLGAFFTRKQIYPWWTGEVYVINTQVVPTSARDEFESGLSRDSLEVAVRNEMRKLQKSALDAQAERRANEIVFRVEEEFLVIRDRIKSGNFDKFETHHDLSVIRDKIDSQKSKSSDPQHAKKITKEIDNLLEWIQKGLDKQIPVSKLKRNAAKAALRDEEQGSKYSPTSVSTNKSKEDIGTIKLHELIERNGWTLDETCKQLIILIGDTLDANLGISSDVYRSVMQDIESGLTDIVEAK